MYKVHGVQPLQKAAVVLEAQYGPLKGILFMWDSKIPLKSYQRSNLAHPSQRYSDFRMFIHVRIARTIFRIYSSKTCILERLEAMHQRLKTV